MKAIVNGKIIKRNEILQDHVILFDQVIRDIVRSEDFKDQGMEIIDANGNYVSPGFVDLHIHGFCGADTMDSTEESMEIMAENLLDAGVTSFLPTTMTMDRKNIENAIENVRRCMEKLETGARILGVHMEGPFISANRKGAQDERFILNPDYEWIESYLDVLRIVTFAPEMHGGSGFIERMKESGVVLAIGHSDASFEQAMDAMDGGVSYVTHSFNAMSGFHHRDPGVVGALLSRDVYCELIADKVHVHPGFFQAFIDINGKDRVILVSDSIMASGLEDGRYSLGGRDVIVTDGVARLGDGTLAGSVLKLGEAIRNVCENTDLPLHEIVNMATYNPAKAIGMDKLIGSLDVGKLSDIVIFDENIEVQSVLKK